MSNHEEFPELTPEAREAFKAGCAAAVAVFPAGPIGFHDRRYLAAFLREAMKQALASAVSQRDVPLWDLLEKIADNLHNPPPPPPTLAQAREAARQLGGEDAAIVNAFLATLGEGGQP